jgi:hypothetical protein
MGRAYFNGATIAHYISYADGNRRYKWANGTITRFLYAGDQEIMETGSSWTDVLRRYVRLPGSVDEPFLMFDYTLPAGNQERSRPSKPAGECDCHHGRKRRSG